MVDIQNVNVRRNWEECPRERGASRWKTLYATLNQEGVLVLSRYTHEELGSPDSYVLLYDRERMVIGLRPARASVDKNAFPVGTRGRHGGKMIRAYRLCREFAISIDKTVRFHQCSIDFSGVLILDLKDTRPTRTGKKIKR